MLPLVGAQSLVSVLGVVYVHKKTSDGGDIYLTEFGLPVEELLELEVWYETAWFQARRERLKGTSSVYKVPTKEVSGRSLELVVKNCRVGEDVPLETRTLEEFINAEFNSPWEEFSLVMEMREGRHGPRDLQIHTQQPLAIYVPPDKMQIWQSGQSQSKINRIVARHPGIDLDILRQYKMIYGWIRGRSIVQLLEGVGLSGPDLDASLKPSSAKAIADMDQKGFAVADMKPDHIIIGEDHVREIEAGFAASGGAEGVAAAIEHRLQRSEYSIVDYELLVRTPAYEEEVTLAQRHSYHAKQSDRFREAPLPEYLKAVEILGVPYVFGHAESTGGRLWVVGRSPGLFDYFLPERWRRTNSWRLSERGDVFYTFTKDHVHIVWKTSRVGETPDEGRFNSPFEEFAIAHDLNKKGVPTVYTRAIYMTGSAKLEQSTDRQCYAAHAAFKDPDGEPILREDRNYITIRGYYNGPDHWVAQQRGRLYRPWDLAAAAAKEMISRPIAEKLYRSTLDRLQAAGYDGTLLEADDMLIAQHPDGMFCTDAEGRTEVRICNLERIQKL